jgi:hypothetical protein
MTSMVLLGLYIKALNTKCECTFKEIFWLYLEGTLYSWVSLLEKKDGILPLFIKSEIDFTPIKKI